MSDNPQGFAARPLGLTRPLTEHSFEQWAFTANQRPVFVGGEFTNAGAFLDEAIDGKEGDRWKLLEPFREILAVTAGAFTVRVTPIDDFEPIYVPVVCLQTFDRRWHNTMSTHAFADLCRSIGILGRPPWPEGVTFELYFDGPSWGSQFAHLRHGARGRVGNSKGK